MRPGLNRVDEMRLQVQLSGSEVFQFGYHIFNL